MITPTAPLGAHGLLVFLVQIGVLLGAAVLMGRVARRLGFPPIVGELTVGVLLGPTVFGQLAPGAFTAFLPRDTAQMHLLDAVGQIGMLLLVGVAGLHVKTAFIWRNRGRVLSVALGALLLPLLLGFGGALLLPDDLHGDHGSPALFAAFIGVALSVSAIPVIAKTLLELNLMGRDIGQLIIGAAAIDDIVGWFLLSLVALAATVHLTAGAVGWALLTVVAVPVLAYIVGRPVVHGVLRIATRSADPGVVTATVTALLLLAAAGTHLVRLEAVLGAFLAGVLIASYRPLRDVHLAPLRTFTMSVLAPIFFATAGLRIDLAALARPSVALTAVVVISLAIVTKGLGSYLGARACRLGHWPGIAVAAGLNARGVVEIVVAMVGLNLGVIGSEMYTVIVLMAIVTSLIAPPALRLAVRRIPAPPQPRPQVVLAGGETRP